MRFDHASAYTVGAVVQDIVELLDALGLVQSDVLGFSFGGIVAQELLATYPSRVKRLVLAATAYPWVPPTAEAPSEPEAGSLEARIKWLFASEPAPQTASRLLAMESLQLDVHLDASMAVAQQLIEKVSFSGEWMAALRARRVREHRRVQIEDLARLGDRLLLLLHGARRFSVEGVRAVHALAPDSCLGIVPEAGHFAFIDAPHLWNDHLANFLGCGTQSRLSTVHICPVHFLQTESGCLTTSERNKAAWEKSYEVLDEVLRSASSERQLILEAVRSRSVKDSRPADKFFLRKPRETYTRPLSRQALQRGLRTSLTYLLMKYTPKWATTNRAIYETQRRPRLYPIPGP